MSLAKFHFTEKREKRIKTIQSCSTNAQIMILPRDHGVLSKLKKITHGLLAVIGTGAEYVSTISY